MALIPLPFDEFRAALLEETRLAFAEVKRLAANERLYRFTLGPNSLGSAMIAEAQTEEGLERYIAARLRRGDSARSGKVEDLLRAVYRWDYNDEFIQLAESFPKTDRILDVSWGSDWEGFCETGITRLVFGTCLNVLQQLDAEGLFGRGSERHALTLGLHVGDQSDHELKRWSIEVNPLEVYDRYADGLDRARSLYQQIKSPYDKE